MSRDGYLPDNVSEDDYNKAFPGNEHHGDCPAQRMKIKSGPSTNAGSRSSLIAYA